jgi:hypothetical protein
MNAKISYLERQVGDAEWALGTSVIPLVNVG